MAIETVFDLTFYLTVPCWALMIFVPHWSVTRRIISSPLIVLPPLVVYVLVLIPQFGQFASAVALASFPDVVAVLGTPAGAAAVWAHAIAFDLFVGRWMYLDSRDRGLHPLVMAPLLVLTILLSPLGLLSYLLVRAVVPARRGVPAGQPV